MVRRTGRQELLWEFKENFNDLLKECNTRQVEIDLSSTVDVYGILSNVIHDTVLERYIAALNRAVVRAKRNLQGIKIDAWNGEENEKRVLELEAQQKKNDRIKDELEQQKEELEKLKGLRREDEAKLAQCGAEIQKRRAIAEATARELVKHREDLLMNMKMLDEAQTENAQLKRFIKQEVLRVENTMKALGVTILNESGKFDKTRHTASSMKPTEDENLAGTIAETVSSGYEYDGKLLKNQEVVVYGIE